MPSGTPTSATPRAADARFVCTGEVRFVTLEARVGPIGGACGEPLFVVGERGFR